MTKKITLVAVLDFLFGVLKRYVKYIIVYCVLIGAVVITLNMHSHIINTILKQSLDTLDIQECIQNGHEFLFAIIIVDMLLELILNVIKYEVLYKSFSFSNIMEGGMTFLIIYLSQYINPVISTDHILVVLIVYFFVKPTYGILVFKFRLKSKYFKAVKENCPAPLGKAVINNGRENSDMTKEELDR